MNYDELSVRKLFLRAKSYQKRNDNAEAIKIYEHILRKYPKNKNAKIALEKFQKKSITKKSDFEFLFKLYNSSEFKKGLEESLIKLENDSKNPFLNNLIGIFYFKLKDLNNALKYYQLSLSFKPDYIEPYNNIGNLYLEKNEYEKSYSFFSKSLKLIQSLQESEFKRNIYSNTMLNIGNLLFKQKNYEEAKKYNEEVLELDPNNVLALSNMGACLSFLGKDDDAVKVLEKSLKIDNKNILALNNLSSIYSRNNKYESGITIGEKMVEYFPNDERSYKSLAKIYLKLENKQKAKEYYTKVLQLNPKDEESKFILNSIDGITPKLAPRSYIENLFDGYSINFEKSLVQDLKYDIPNIMKEFYEEKIGFNNNINNGIDLGCGTGLSGQPFQSNIENFYGIDLSFNMIEIAKKKNIYKKLYHFDLNDFLSKTKSKYDFIIALDVFIYVGELLETFENISKCSENGASFIFCTEHQSDEGFKLVKARYRHSESYIKKVLAITGFDFVDYKLVDLRKGDDNNEWIPGAIYIAKRKSRNADK